MGSTDDPSVLARQSVPIKVGDRIIETTIRGDRREYEVAAVDQPPTNPGADPGPYVKCVAHGLHPLMLRPQDIEREDWLEHVPA